MGASITMKSTKNFCPMAMVSVCVCVCVCVHTCVCVCVRSSVRLSVYCSGVVLCVDAYCSCVCMKFL